MSALAWLSKAESYQVTAVKNPRTTLVVYPASKVTGTTRDESFASSATGQADE